MRLQIPAVMEKTSPSSQFAHLLVMQLFQPSSQNLCPSQRSAAKFAFTLFINKFATRVPAWYPPLDAAVRSNPYPALLSPINLQVRS
jgi:hypothetical protein